MEYHAILLGGTSADLGGRMLNLPRLRTAASRSGFDVLAVDCLYFLSQDEIIDLLKKFMSTKTKVIGFSLPWYVPGYIESTWVNEEIVAKIRTLWPEIIIITGNQIIRTPIKSDYHFIGLSDISFVEFLKKVCGQPTNIFIQKPLTNQYKYVINSDTSNPIIDVNDTSTEWILGDDLNPLDTLPLEVSRGCVFSCSFCRFPGLGKKHNDYIRSAANIAGELRRNFDLFGITRYNIVDNTFNDNMYKLNILREALDIAKLPKFEFCAFIKPETLATKGGEMIPVLIELGLVGSYLGIESVNNESRRAINKGMDINRILYASYRLVSDSKGRVKNWASMIIGLPNDTIDMIHESREFFIKEQDKLFKQWRYYALDMRAAPPGELTGTISAMEKDPLKYGYNLPPDGEWTNKHMTHKIAMDLMESLWEKDKDVVKAGGWNVSSCWFLNMTTLEQFDQPVSTYRAEYVNAIMHDARRRYTNLMAR